MFNESALGADELVICEGEIDCITLAQAGIAAVTSTAGCAHFADAWIPAFTDKCVTVWLDADPPGRAAALHLARRLEGVATGVRIVRDWAHKDVNEGAVE